MKLKMSEIIPHGSYEPDWSKRLMVSAQKAQGQLRVQEFLDDVADLENAAPDRRRQPPV